MTGLLSGPHEVFKYEWVAILNTRFLSSSTQATMEAPQASTTRSGVVIRQLEEEILDDSRTNITPEYLKYLEWNQRLHHTLNTGAKKLYDVISKQDIPFRRFHRETTEALNEVQTLVNEAENAPYLTDSEIEVWQNNRDEVLPRREQVLSNIGLL